MNTRITSRFTFRATILALLLFTLSSSAAPPTFIEVPWVIDSANPTNYTRTNLPAWWDGGTNFWNWSGGTNTAKGVAPWMAWQAVAENFRRANSNSIWFWDGSGMNLIISTNVGTFSVDRQGAFGNGHLYDNNDGTMVISGVPYRWPTNDAAGVLTNDGGGTLSWVASSTAIPTTAPPGMVLIPAGEFVLGDYFGDADITDASVVFADISAFFVDVNPVTWSQWESVYHWATNHGYDFSSTGSGKGASYPVGGVDWYDAVKWCNARSEQLGKTPVYYIDEELTVVFRSGQVDAYPNWTAKGYRLPTEAEWEKAARGGVTGQRFPWGNVINQNLANYHSSTNGWDYDLGPDGYNPAYTNGGTPYTSPVGSFAANGYGLHDVSGNAEQWCWDWYATPYDGGTNPHGATSGTYRIARGGGYAGLPPDCRMAIRTKYEPTYEAGSIGFRCAMPAVP